MKKASPKDVLEFRTRYGLDQNQMDLLFGLSDKGNGRATRRWEKDGAPGTVTVLMAYIEHYGIDFARNLTGEKKIGLSTEAA